jgi:hypothetical protein
MQRAFAFVFPRLIDNPLTPSLSPWFAGERE